MAGATVMATSEARPLPMKLNTSKRVTIGGLRDVKILPLIELKEWKCDSDYVNGYMVSMFQNKS